MGWKLLIGFLLGVALAWAVLYYLPDETAQRQMAALAGSVAGKEPVPLDASSWRGLPPVVQRYFELVLAQNPRRLVLARFEEAGSFRPDPGRPWARLKAWELFSCLEPSFVWSARVDTLPLVPVWVRESLYRHRGEINAQLFKMVTVADVRGPELDQSQLARWLASTPLFPTVLLDGSLITWRAGDAASAKVEVDYAGLSAQGVFHFDKEGRIVSFETRDRYRNLGTAGAVRQRWTVIYQRYRLMGGYLLPGYLEARWSPPGGEVPYVRLMVTGAAFNQAARR